MDTRTQRGFTLWELMVAVAVAGVVLSFGVPSFMEFQRNNAMASAANDFVTGLLMARAEAVKRQTPIVLCASDDATAAEPECSASGQDRGFVVFVDANDDDDLTDATDGNGAIDDDELVLLQRAAPGGTIKVWSDANHVSFAPNGYPTAGSAKWVLFCDDRGNRTSVAGLSSARALKIEPTGRGQVFQAVDDIETALADLEDADISAECSS